MDQYNLKLARVTPIPNLTTNTVVQHDYTTPPFGRTTLNLQLSVPIPLFDRNHGNILAADGTLNARLPGARPHPQRPGQHPGRRL